MRQFTDFVEDHYEAIYNLLYRLLGDRSVADDVTQEVFLRAFRGWSRFRNEASEKTWVYHIAINESRRYLKRAARHRTVSLDQVQNEEAFHVQQGLSGRASSVQGVEDRTYLWEMIQLLPQRQREVVVLYYLQERSVKEVAEFLKMPLGTVKIQLFRARQELRERWGVEDEPKSASTTRLKPGLETAQGKDKNGSPS